MRLLVVSAALLLTAGCASLPADVDALAARMVLAEKAERSQDVQYCIWHGDLTGRLFAHAQLRAADRGVQLRILVDDVGTRANDDTLLSLAAHPNVQIHLFNPVANRSFRGLGMLSDSSRTNRRMDNNSFVADSQCAVLGGRITGQLRRELLIVSPYFVPGDAGVAGLSSLVWDESTPGGVVQRQDEPAVSAGRLLGVGFPGLMPIESQL